MPLDPTDPYYLAETVPASIDALGRGLCSAYNRPSGAFGAKGNTIHYYGYHRSRRWILSSSDSSYGSADYSVRQTLDKAGNENWISAFDFTPGSWGTPGNRALMRELTGRVYTAAKARDPRLSAMREFAGTLDGVHVVTFNCADGSLKGAFDSSHLDHVHGSLWRSRAANDHTPILNVMLGIEDDMTPEQDLRLKQVAAVVRADRMQWITDRAGFIAAGGDPNVWDIDGGMGLNEEAKLLAQLAADVAELKARPPVEPAPVDVDALAAALLANPAFAKLLQDSAFEGSQRAERE